LSQPSTQELDVEVIKANAKKFSIIVTNTFRTVHETKQSEEHRRMWSQIRDTFTAYGFDASSSYGLYILRVMQKLDELGIIKINPTIRESIVRNGVITPGSTAIGLCIVPTQQVGGHSYPIGRPALVTHNTGSWGGLMMEGGNLGNNLTGYPNDCRLATPEEIVQLIDTIPANVIMNRFAIFSYVKFEAMH